MALESLLKPEGSQPPTEESLTSSRLDTSSPDHRRSSSSASTTSLIFENLASNVKPSPRQFARYRDEASEDEDYSKFEAEFEELDIEEGPRAPSSGVNRKYKRWLWACGSLCLIIWAAALLGFLFSGSYKIPLIRAHKPDGPGAVGAGKRITLEQLQNGNWRPRSHDISWITGPKGEDGMLLERGGAGGKDYLVVEDIRSWKRESNQPAGEESTTLMKSGSFEVDGVTVRPIKVWPSPDLKTVLCASDLVQNWRHSFTALYWLFDVDSQSAQPLDPSDPEARIQLAQWSPNSDAVIFTRKNNMFLRRLDGDVKKVTTNGGKEMFNGVPDWVYEEEVFSGNSATWWSLDGKYIAFLATNESRVPEYPVQYFLSRPSGKQPEAGLENYPEVRHIKYPKAGAPNPVVRLRFYDVDANSIFDVPVENDFSDDDRIITEVVWASNGKALIRETNRASDVLKMVLVRVTRRTGEIVRSHDVEADDGGWVEITEKTTFVPADPSNGREEDGYIDTVIHDGYNHLGYFTPLDNSTPRLLTSGKWEVVSAPSAVDVKNNYVYFVATKRSSIERHVYKVTLNGTGLEPLTDTKHEGYYSASFSKGAGYVLMNYEGPNIPMQHVTSTPSNPHGDFKHLIEHNNDLAKFAEKHELPHLIYDTVTIEGFKLNVLERRPPHFDKNKKYPVLFYLYGGPGSQTVAKQFNVDFQSYVAATLGYIVVTVDGRGTGFIGRKARCIIRRNIGYYEAYDQIQTAKTWAKKSYVDENRIAIWGWSYGGYMTLKTLEQDAGETFKYGMAVAPVTDWRFYDSIYTERWMHTPQENPEGYHNASVHNVTAIAKNVRWLMMHGVADDNVHLQNTLKLIDDFDRESIENYDLHFFPDSNHGIYFHNANRIVWDKLSWWLINAFNGEWERIKKVVPLRAGQQVGTKDEG